MTDRKQEIAWLERIERDIRRKQGQCHCGRGPVRAETEQCESCDLDGQANVIDLDADHIRAWGG